MSDARLIALDWGTSNLRASLLGAAGRMIERRNAAVGVMAVPERRFEAALRALCGDWIDTHRVPLVASGMIGSRQGWIEAPYLDCPATLEGASARLVTVPLQGGARLHIVPGLSCVGADAQADVMRGEETQLWGAALIAGQCCVLPGTHSKWAWMGAADAIEGFRTYMTGELYGLLTQHGILGRLMVFGQGDQPASFEAGARLGLAEHAHATHVIFAARTAGLMQRVAPAGLPDFLSGILIGAEIGSALAGRPVDTVTLLGESALCERYAAALALAGVASRRAPDEATTHGQWRLALRARLLEDTCKA